MFILVTTDGDWGTWGPFGQCSVQCGSGLKVRHRYCDSPSPQNGGLQCEPPAVDATVCDGLDCSDGWYMIPMLVIVHQFQLNSFKKLICKGINV